MRDNHTAVSPRVMIFPALAVSSGLVRRPRARREVRAGTAHAGKLSLSAKALTVVLVAYPMILDRITAASARVISP